MNLLKRWYFKDGITEISALKVWQDCCHYLYLPRLVKDDVFKNAINLGVHSQDFFGFASGKSGDNYLGFVFGGSASIILDESSLLIELNTAAAYKETLKPVEHVTPSKMGDGGIGNGVDKTPPTVRPQVDSTPPVSTPAKKHFYGTINLDPVRAKIDFAKIVDEVVEQFTSKLGVDVKISIEIQATSNKDGFDDAMQRLLKRILISNDLPPFPEKLVR